MRIYRDKDVDLGWLRRKTCAVIGFGAQGRAQALNLRDSGMRVHVGLYPGSKSRLRAKRSGLEVVSTVEAVRPGGEVVWLGKIDVNNEVSFRWGALMQEKRIRRQATATPAPRVISLCWRGLIWTDASCWTS